MLDNVTLVLVHGALIVLFARIVLTRDPEETPPPRAGPGPRPRLPGTDG